MDLKIFGFHTNFETLKTSNKNLIHEKHVDQVSHYNFDINHVNI